MEFNGTLLLVLAILFLATFVRSAFGFGEALIAVPLLALIIPIKIAAPVAVLISITVAGVVVAQDWRHIHVSSAGWLILSTVIGTPLGLFLLTTVPRRIVMGCLGLIILLFALYCLCKKQKAVLDNDRTAWIFGFGAGVLGGAYGMNGPPLVVYGALRGWSPQHFRATLQGYFLPASIMTMGGYWLTGLWTTRVTHYYFLSLPAVVAAIFLGRAANKRMSGQAFLQYIYLGLIGIGCVLLYQSLLNASLPAA